MSRQLTSQEADLIFDNEYRKLREMDEEADPCDLYDKCEDCPNRNEKCFQAT